jgi:hypothetical protein
VRCLTSGDRVGIIQIRLQQVGESVSFAWVDVMYPERVGEAFQIFRFFRWPSVINQCRCDSFSQDLRIYTDLDMTNDAIQSPTATRFLTLLPAMDDNMPLKQQILGDSTSRGLLRSAVLLLILSVMSVGVLYSQTTFYIDSNTGDDANSGTRNKPFATFSRATAYLHAGDTLIVRGGTYHEWVQLNRRDGTPSRPIVITAYPGETPIIDGQNALPGNGNYGLVQITAKYYYVAGLTIRNSNGLGAALLGTGNTLHGVHVHKTQSTGIGAYGDSSIVEDCLVHDVAMDNFEGYKYRHGGSWGAGITAARGGWSGDQYTDYAILRRNVVHDVWGEGISSFEANHTLFEDNVVYDCYSTMLYLSNLQYGIARGNLVYGTKVMANAQYGVRADGIRVGDETDYPSLNDTIYNNIVYGVGQCMTTGSSGNGLIANNTFMNTTATSNVLLWGDTAGVWNYVNNVIVQEDGFPIILFANPGITRTTFSHNFWSKTPNSRASGTGDIVGDPRLAKTGSVKAGELTREYFDLQRKSPAINAGVKLGFPFEGKAPDMGARENGASIGNYLQPPAPATPPDGAPGRLD